MKFKNEIRMRNHEMTIWILGNQLSICVNMSRNINCLFWEPHTKNTCIMWAECRIIEL